MTASDPWMQQETVSHVDACNANQHRADLLSAPLPPCTQSLRLATTLLSETRPSDAAHGLVIRVAKVWPCTIGEENEVSSCEVERVVEP